MSIEIERKYCVHPELLPVLEHGQRMLQGYLAVEPSIRFRVIGQDVIITIKRLLPDGSRFEFETTKSKVSSEELEQLVQCALFTVIEKIRFRLPYAGLIWEIDVYQGENQGLITADVELPSIDTAISFPPWIDGEREITQDSRFFNINLGQRPFRQWSRSDKSMANFSCSCI